MIMLYEKLIPEFAAKGPRTTQGEFFPARICITCNFLISQAYTFVENNGYSTSMILLALFIQKQKRQKYRTKMSNVILNNRFTKGWKVNVNWGD